MKIIITYVSAGTGHRRAAQALYNYFKENCPDHDLQIVDALQKSNPLFKNIYSYGYPFLVNHALWLWRLGFRVTYIKIFRPIIKILVSFTGQLNAKNFANFLIKEDADFIISTHFFSSEIIAHLKKDQKLKSKLITVITDFGIHPFWIQDTTDIYIAASDYSKKLLVREGIAENRIKDLGIPIDSRFLTAYDKNELYKKFNRQPKFTVLIVTGSFGIGKIEEIVDLLYKEVQILVVCGQNKILYARLKKRNYPQLKVFGFIDNIQELMAISDIIITKPGGLTISESLAMDLVPIFITAIPGQETENARILARKAIGMDIKHIASIKDIILDFKNHPDKLKSIKERIGREKKPFATKDLCNVICQGSVRVTS